MSGGGSGSSNTVTSTQAIPEFEQEASQNNQALAASLGSQPYPTYQGPLIQGQNQLQTQGEQQAVNASGSYQPSLDAATQVTQGALNPSGVNGLVGQAANQVGAGLNPSGVNAYSSAAAGQIGQALNTNATTPGAIASYMNPYIEQALAPQIQDLNLQLGQQQQQINTQATQAGAFGDARQGAAQALTSLYGDQAMNQLIGTGYGNAYTAAQQALQQQQNAGLTGAAQLGNLANIQGTEQQIQLAGAGQLGNLAGILGNEQNTQLAGGQQLAGLGGLQQSLGITGANAVYGAGTQQQQQGQTELNAAYQQYLNQVNWPYQMLNVQESALSNSPYNIATAVQLPNANTAAQGFGALTGIAGLLGGLGSGKGSTGANVFGGTG